MIGGGRRGGGTGQEDHGRKSAEFLVGFDTRTGMSRRSMWGPTHHTVVRVCGVREVDSLEEGSGTRDKPGARVVPVDTRVVTGG